MFLIMVVVESFTLVLQSSITASAQSIPCFLTMLVAAGGCCCYEREECGGESVTRGVTPRSHSQSNRCSDAQTTHPLRDRDCKQQREIVVLTS